MSISDFMERANGSVAIAHEKGDAIIELLATVVGRLDDLQDTLEAQRRTGENTALVGSGTSNAAGGLDVVLTIPVGYALDLVSFAALAAAGGGFLIYLNDTSPSSLLYATVTSTFFSDQFPDDQFAPEGSQIICRFLGVGASTACSVTIRARRLTVDQTRAIR